MSAYKSLLLAFCGVIAASAAFTSCKLDEPVIPEEELYLRSFIQKYGLIDPTQDFVAAKQSEVTVNLLERARVVNVYAKVGDDYYRVACYADVEGSINIPMDISTCTDELVVEVDNVLYYTSPGGTVNVLSGSASAKSRALDEASFSATELWINPAYWTSETAKNGETKDAQTARQTAVIPSTGNMTDYIDVTACAWVAPNIKTTSPTHNVALGQVGYPTNSSTALTSSCKYEVGNTQEGSNVRFLIDNQCEGMTSFALTFRTASKNDAKVRVIIIGENEVQSGLTTYLDRTLSVEDNKGGVAGGGTWSTYKGGTDYVRNDKTTEWEIRTDMMPKGKYELIVIGWDTTEDTERHNSAGTWGFFKMRRAMSTSDMAWILACEDLGTTDDFDFNDVIIRIESVNTNAAALKIGLNQWQMVTDDNPDFVLHAPARTSRDDSDGPITRLKVTALAAGGIYPIWLHFRDPNDKTDYILCPNATGAATTEDAGKKAASAVATSEASDETNEWHRWFPGITEHSKMLNTGWYQHLDGKSMIFTAKGFSMEKYSYIQFGNTSGMPNFDSDPWGNTLLQWKWQMENQAYETIGFFLTVYNPDVASSEASILSKNIEGIPPQIIVFPDCNPMVRSGYDRKFGWEWPTERASILETYPDFDKWVQDKLGERGAQWFMNPLPGMVTDDNKLYSRDPNNRTPILHDQN